MLSLHLINRFSTDRDEVFVKTWITSIAVFVDPWIMSLLDFAYLKTAHKIIFLIIWINAGKNKTSAQAWVRIKDARKPENKSVEETPWMSRNRNHFLGSFNIYVVVWYQEPEVWCRESK